MWITFDLLWITFDLHLDHVDVAEVSRPHTFPNAGKAWVEPEDRLVLSVDVIMILSASFRWREKYVWDTSCWRRKRVDGQLHLTCILRWGGRFSLHLWFFFILLIASEGSTWRLGHWLFTEHCLNKTEMLLGIEHINADLRSIVVEGHNIFKVTNSVCYGRLYDDQ